MAAAITGLIPESADPAAAFLGNGTGTGVLDTALLASSWVFVETSTAATQGTTGDVQVYRPADSSFYMAVEKVSAIIIRFRFAESYNAGTEAFNQPVAGSASGSSVTPTATYAVTDTPAVIGTHGSTIMGYIELSTPLPGFWYLVRVDATHMYCGTLNMTTTAAAQGRWVQGGCFTSLFEAFNDTHPIYMAGGPAGGGATSWISNTNNTYALARTSRAPGITTAGTGPFVYHLVPPIPDRIQATTSDQDATYGQLGILGRSSPIGFLNPIALQATLHGAPAGITNGQGTFRGYIPNQVIGIWGNSGTGVATFARFGTQVYVDGALYYILGWSASNVPSNSFLGAIGGGQQQFVAIRAAA